MPVDTFRTSHIVFFTLLAPNQTPTTTEYQRDRLRGVSRERLPHARLFVYMGSLGILIGSLLLVILVGKLERIVGLFA